MRCLIRSNVMIDDSNFIFQISAMDVQVDVGEDRIIIEVPKKNQILDIFIPYRIIQKNVRAILNQNTGVRILFSFLLTLSDLPLKLVAKYIYQALTSQHVRLFAVRILVCSSDHFQNIPSNKNVLHCEKSR